MAYKFLGIEKPLYINLEVKMENDNELPLDLEQVDSPESDNSMALDSHAVSFLRVFFLSSLSTFRKIDN